MFRVQTRFDRDEPRFLKEKRDSVLHRRREVQAHRVTLLRYPDARGKISTSGDRLRVTTAKNFE